MKYGCELIEKEICQRVSDALNSVGLQFRIFSRTKDVDSIEEKIIRKRREGTPYSRDKKLIQDIIGIRVITYFKDDIEVVRNILKEILDYKEIVEDKPESAVFSPKRTNIICSFNKSQLKTFREAISQEKSSISELLDSTFELQLRTILSEGWHEIDHSLRYKCKDDWNGHYEYERLLNGIYASLESNDIALKNLFNELAYKHFKEKNWEGLLRTKLRLKFELTPLKRDIVSILDEDNSIGKALVKLDRGEILIMLYKLDLSLPINMNNIIFQINAIEIRNDSLLNITPKIILNGIQN